LLISIIVAMAKNRCIGRAGKLPWHLPGDLRRFKCLTMGHSLLMGRKTFEGIGQALPGRSTYVLSRSDGFEATGCRVFSNLTAAIETAENTGETELFVCGGEDIYRQTLPICQRLYLTELARELAGDAYFPALPAEQFQRVRRVNLVEDENYTCSVYERRG
jgi:dihydrofolate reductase